MDIEKLQKVWDKLGEKDPLWAALSIPQKKGNKWNIEEFFETGRKKINNIMDYLDELNIKPNSNKVLDFGCRVIEYYVRIKFYFIIAILPIIFSLLLSI